MESKFTKNLKYIIDNAADMLSSAEDQRKSHKKIEPNHIYLNAIIMHFGDMLESCGEDIGDIKEFPAYPHLQKAVAKHTYK